MSMAGVSDGRVRACMRKEMCTIAAAAAAAAATSTSTSTTNYNTTFPIPFVCSCAVLCSTVPCR
jgi:hypothetical protein